MDRRTVAALRFGYGFHPGQEAPDGARDLLAQLKRPPVDISGPPRAARMAMVATHTAARRAAQKDATKKPMVTEATKALRRRASADAMIKLYAAVNSPRGFQERLAWFWADHFTVAAKQARMMAIMPLFEVEAIRPHLAGNFTDMLIAAATHPVMLVYLDQMSSIGPDSIVGKRRDRGLNENLAREVIELHTLGVGGPYTQADVRGLAELMTGMSVDRDTGGFTYRRNIAQPGPKTVMGRTYGRLITDMADVRAALTHLAEHPATAAHMARKIAVHFCADDPPKRLVGKLERAWRDGGGDLPRVYRALLEADEAWETFGEKARQPFDWLAASLRAFGVTGQPDEKEARYLTHALSLLNQPVGRAPGPDGWPEEARDWITPQGLTVRLDVASRLARRHGRGVDPRRFVRTALGDAARAPTLFAAENAAEAWEGIALTLASPEFNRR